MRVDHFRFGSIRVDGVTYENDLLIDRGRVQKRKKKRSKAFRDEFGHTPLSVEEAIPWKCQTLIVGTGAEGALPVMPEVVLEANRRHVDLVVVPTAQAIDLLNQKPSKANAILHVTC